MAKSQTLDLHGFTQEQVEPAVDAFLLKMSAKGESRVRIMSGKGKGLVKRTVINYLKRARYPWHYEKLKNGKPNEGVLVVIMD